MLRHRLEYIGVRSLIGAVRFMPAAMVDACGSALGLTFYALDRSHRRVAERNVAAAFPTRTPAEHTAIVRGAFSHFGRLLFELLKFSTLTTDQMLARVEFEGEERVRSAYAQGKGVLFVYGNYAGDAMNFDIASGSSLPFGPVDAITQNAWIWPGK